MPAPEIAVAYVSIVPSLAGFQRDLRDQVVGPAEEAGADAGAGMGSRLREGLKAGAVAAAAVAGAVIVKGLTDAIEQAHIKKVVQAQLGATGKDAAKYGKIAGQLYTSGVTDTFEEAAQAIRKTMESGIAPPGATNAQLKDIATKAADLAGVFEQDLGGVTNAVSQMLRTGLADSATEAFDVLTRGFQNGSNKADDLLDTFNEYSTQFRKLGLDGETALGIISQLVQAGARDSDIAADALKEFSIRAVDGSKAAADAYKALGLDAEGMTAQIAKGGADATAGLTTVIERLKAMSDPVAREAAAVGLFGTQAEDLGEALFAMDPSKAVESLGKVGGAATEMGDTVRGGPMHEIQTFTRTLQQGLVNVLGTYVIPAIGEFVNVVKTVAGAVVGAWNWLTDIAPYLAPFAVGIAGITLAMNAQAIATGIVTGVFAAYRAVMLTGIAITNGMAIAQGLLNAVMALNPFVLIVIAIAAFVTALIVAYQKSETFRNIVQTALSAVGDAFSWLWNTVLKPIFGFLDVAFRALLTLVTVLVIAPIIIAVELLGALFGWLWDEAIKPAIDGISDGLSLLWTTIFQPIFGYIGDKATWLWEQAIKPAWDEINKGIDILSDAFSLLWNEYVKPIFDWIGEKATWLWDEGIKPAFDKLRDGVDLVKESFRKAKDMIGEQWDKLQEIARKPVAFIVNTVYNKGIVPLWNKVADAFGAPKLKEMKGFARGGILPGQSSWRSGDDQLVPMRRGEGVYVSEAMKDPYERARLFAVNRAAMRGQSLSKFRDSGFGYATGGLVGFAKGGIFSQLGNVAGDAWELAKAGASWIGDTLESSARAGVKQVVNPLLAQIPGANTMFGKAVRGIPNKIIDSIFGYSKEADSKLGSGKWGKPVNAAIGTRYGVAGKMWSSGYHTGTDFPAPTGTLVKAVQRGVVSAVGSTGPYGNHLRMSHPGGMGSLYAHLSSIAVKAGQSVAKGAAIGRVGSTGNSSGPHLHLEAFKNGARINPESLFDNGGWLQPGATPTVNKTGRPEPVLTASQWADVSALAARGGSGLQPGDRLILTTGAGTDFEVYVDQRAGQRINDELTGPAGLGRRF